jgi:hypothetical protein
VCAEGFLYGFVGFLRWEADLPCVVTRGILEEMMPFEALPVCILCSPMQVCKSFEAAVAYLPLEYGKLPQLSGIQLRVNVSRRPFQRLMSATLWMGRHWTV